MVAIKFPGDLTYQLIDLIASALLLSHHILFLNKYFYVTKYSWISCAACWKTNGCSGQIFTLYGQKEVLQKYPNTFFIVANYQFLLSFVVNFNLCLFLLPNDVLIIYLE